MVKSKLLFVVGILSGLLQAIDGLATPPNRFVDVEEFGITKDEQSRADGDYRLPNSSRPIHYVIKLNPHLTDNNFTFTGEIQITLAVVETTNVITLHSKDQTIQESRTTLTSIATNTTYAVTHTYDTVRDFLSLTTTEALAVGNYSLTLHYTGPLRDDMIGFYKSSYTNDAGETVWIATSKFEPIYARYAFPCYDEPALKATVDIWLKRYESQHSLANTPILTENTDSSDGKIWSVFQTTPLTSTYLIAFIASDFESIRTTDGSFGVWARPAAISTAQVAFDFGLVALESLENYTNVDYYEYMLDKMDQIAIPDFASGAMENWGLVTYRERYLLFADGISTTSDEQSITTVIAHEFTHQWFGNLVSPYWWTYLWLNEGFATFFEYFTTAEIKTGWRLEEQFVVTEIHADSFVADGLGTSHAMNADVETLAEIKSIFDSISYAKASVVIRMMEHIVTNAVFRNSLTMYLNANAFSYGTSDLLWNSVQQAVDAAGQSLDVKTIMDTWVTQAGYPVVTVTRDYSSNTAVLSQERFFLKNDGSYDPSVYWWVPINWVSSSDLDFSVTTPTTWIPGNTSISLDSIDAEWILLNKQQTGYYRVNYDQTNWNLLISFLESSSYSQIIPVNRAQLIDDSLNLARGGYLDYATAFSLTKYLSQETDYIPWYSAFTAFTYINRLLATTDYYDNFKTHEVGSDGIQINCYTAAGSKNTHVLGLLTGALENVGYAESNDEDHVQRFFRTNVLTWACNLGNEDCLAFTNEKLLSWLVDNDDTAITPDLKSTIYCYGIRNVNASVWNLMWQKYLATDLSSEQVRILRGLGCTEDEDILNEYMRLATTSGSGIRSQDSATAFAAVYGGSQNNIDVALDYVINNLEALIEYYGGATSVATLLSGIGARITTTEQQQKLKNFATAQATLLETAANTGLASAEDNLYWINTYAADIGAWLDENVSTGGSAPTTICNSLLAFALLYVFYYFH